MATHTSMIVREASNLYVISAQNDAYFSHKKRGVQRTELNEWLEEAKGAGYDLAWLPLKPELRDFTKNSWS